MTSPDDKPATKSTADTLPEAEAAALAITDPAPPPRPVKSSPAPGLRLGAEPDPAPSKAVPDAELAALAAIARATCGCQGCTGTRRQQGNAVVTSRKDGAPQSCVVREVMAELIARRSA